MRRLQHPPACFAAAVDAQHDAQAAVRWLRKNAAAYRLDATRIGIGGASAGAITATEVGLRPDDPGDSRDPGFSLSVGDFVSIAGGLLAGAFASPGDAPGLLFHGGAERVVPFAWSAQTTAALNRAGVPAFVQPLVGGGHVDYTRYRDRYLQQTNYFLYASLDLSRAQGQPVAAARASDRRAQPLRALRAAASGAATQLRALQPLRVTGSVLSWLMKGETANRGSPSSCIAG